MLETEIVLHRAGITSNYKGYWLLNSAIDILLENPEAKDNIVDVVYKTLAKEFEISAVSVERNIHTAIKRRWEVAPERLNSALDRKRIWQPTASEFIFFVLEKLKNDI